MVDVCVPAATRVSLRRGLQADAVSYTTLEQESLCAFFHLGSFIYTVLIIILISGFVRGYSPLITELTKIIIFPAVVLENRRNHDEKEKPMDEYLARLEAIQRQLDELKKDV